MGVLSAILLIFSSWPVKRSIVQFDTAERGFLVSTGETNGRIQPDENGMVVLPTRYLISLESPVSLKKGSTEPLRLSVQQKGAFDSKSPLAEWQVSAEATLSLSESIVHPDGTIIQRLEEDNPADFVWLLSGKQNSVDSGTLWLYLLYLSPQKAPPVRILVLARPISLAVSSFLGFRYQILQIAASLGLLFGGLMMMSKRRF
ncbi:MAG TPA: hypothetical protein VN452_08955 [Longilinea sp.]|nr:hypothetical protein [Longilinea sp.]